MGIAVKKFQARFSDDQLRILEDWLETTRFVWNEGVALLREHEDNSVLATIPVLGQDGNPILVKGKPKKRGIAVPAVRLPTSFFKNELVDKEGNKSEVWGQCSYILPRRRRGGTVRLWSGQTYAVWEKFHLDPVLRPNLSRWLTCQDLFYCLFTSPEWFDIAIRYRAEGAGELEDAEPVIRVGQCCPISRPMWVEPRLGKRVEGEMARDDAPKELEALGKFSLQYYFTQRNIRQGRYSEETINRFCKIPSWFVRGVCDDLWLAWSKYRAGQGGIPKFKRKRDAKESLTHSDGKVFTVDPFEEEVKEQENGILEIAQLGQVPVRAIRDIWGSRLPAAGREGWLNIPRLGKVLVKDLWKDWGDTSIKVFQLVKDGDHWFIHLTGFKAQIADCYDILSLAMLSGLLHSGNGDLFSKGQKRLRSFPYLLAALDYANGPLWGLKRTAKTVLTVPGEGDVVAIDDRGRSYDVRPRRASDGILDPNQKVFKLRKKIADLQRQVSTQENRLERDRNSVEPERMRVELQERMERLERLVGKQRVILEHDPGNDRASQRFSELVARVKKINQNLCLLVTQAEQVQPENLNRGRRLYRNRKRLRRCQRRLTRILSNNRKKMAEFLSERSGEITILVKQEKQTRIKKPKGRLKPGAAAPPAWESNGAERVAERNREFSGSAPGEFIRLIQTEGNERRQRVVKVEEKSPEKQKKGKIKKGASARRR